MFEGKTLEEVKRMKYYSWEIEDESVIKAEKSKKLKEGIDEMKTVKTKSGKAYTKKQICEAIAYWESVLEKMELDEEDNERYSTVSPIEWRGIKGFLCVADVLDAISQASY